MLKFFKIYIYIYMHKKYVYIYIYIYIHTHTHMHKKYAYIYKDISHGCVCIYIYIYIYTHGAFNKFPDFLVQAFKIVVDSWKFSMLLLYILWDGWPIFMISGSKLTATAAIGIHPSKAWLSQLVNFKNSIWTCVHFRRMICNKIVL